MFSEKGNICFKKKNAYSRRITSEVRKKKKKKKTIFAKI